MLHVVSDCCCLLLAINFTLDIWVIGFEVLLWIKLHPVHTWFFLQIHASSHLGYMLSGRISICVSQAGSDEHFLSLSSLPCTLICGMSYPGFVGGAVMVLPS